MKGIAMLEPRNFVICWFGHLSLNWSVAGLSPIFAQKVGTRPSIFYLASGSKVWHHIFEAKQSRQCTDIL